MRYHVTRIKSEIIKAPKARKTLGKLNWAIQLSSFPSFFFFFFTYNEVRQIVYRFKAWNLENSDLPKEKYFFSDIIYMAFVMTHHKYIPSRETYHSFTGTVTGVFIKPKIMILAHILPNAISLCDFWIPLLRVSTRRYIDKIKDTDPDGQLDTKRSSIIVSPRLNNKPSSEKQMGAIAEDFIQR